MGDVRVNAASRSALAVKNAGGERIERREAPARGASSSTHNPRIFGFSLPRPLQLPAAARSPCLPACLLAALLSFRPHLISTLRFRLLLGFNLLLRLRLLLLLLSLLLVLSPAAAPAMRRHAPSRGLPVVISPRPTAVCIPSMLEPASADPAVPQDASPIMHMRVIVVSALVIRLPYEL